jgi:coenzyme F420-0:L-glutamate ligase / coenzyme F420-1:gamma-L-glutamate ligase
MAPISAHALAGIPELRAGDDLAALIVAALGGVPLREQSLLAVAHTAVSKVEAAVVDLRQVHPGERALELARQLDKDPRAVQVTLEQSSEVLRAERGVLICRTRHGFVCANAGVDVSNAGSGEKVIVLPSDPDASARRLRARLRELTGVSPAVLISDSFGRAWRNGQVDVAVGLAGLQPLDDWRGRSDARGVQLKATWLAVADAAAAAADLARRKDSREPVVLIEGLADYVTDEDGPGAAALLRPLEEDLFG